MPTWYVTNRSAVAVALAGLLFGGIEVFIYLMDGLERADLHTPFGTACRALAGWFAPPQSAVRAGTDHRELTYQIFMWGHVAITMVFSLLAWSRLRLGRGQHLRGRMLLVAQMLLGALSMSALLYVLAGQLAVVLPLRQALKWLAAQMLLLLAAFTYMFATTELALGDHLVKMLVIYCVLGLLFQAITFGVTHLVMREHAARMRLMAANASLQATQSLLADTVRGSERTRIARDLHDAVGHHLTALNLHLDLALRQVDAAAPESLHTSRELASKLLSEVRVVVSSERSEQRIDLGAALTTLCAGIPAPAVRLRFDQSIDITSPALAHTLFSCVQEALTNAIRHADAGEVTIDVRWVDGEVLLQIGDDGRGARGANEGNGLRGMRERVAKLGGSLLAHQPSGRGFGLEIALPLARGAA